MHDRLPGRYVCDVQHNSAAAIAGAGWMLEEQVELAARRCLNKEIVCIADGEGADDGRCKGCGNGGRFGVIGGAPLS